jgi:hypothetical protein
VAVVETDPALFWVGYQLSLSNIELPGASIADGLCP